MVFLHPAEKLLTAYVQIMVRVITWTPFLLRTQSTKYFEIQQRLLKNVKWWRVLIISSPGMQDCIF